MGTVLLLWRVCELRYGKLHNSCEQGEQGLRTTRTQASRNHTTRNQSMSYCGPTTRTPCVLCPPPTFWYAASASPLRPLFASVAPSLFQRLRKRD